MPDRDGRHVPPGEKYYKPATPQAFAYTCRCGKRSYTSRAVAKTVARRLHNGASVYRCRLPGMDGLFHVGHLPRDVVKGKKTRGDIYPPKGDGP